MKQLVLIVLVFFYQCGGDSVPTTFVITPKGATIYSAKDIPRDLAPIVDSQLDVLFEKSTAKGYEGYSGHNSYKIRLVQGTTYCDRYSFSVKGNCNFCWGQPNCQCYDGSEYDHDSTPNQFDICVAGRYLPNEDIIEIPETALRETEALIFEGEHRVLRQTNHFKYMETLVHGPGTRHPIY
jgi:hypothetical protein